MYIIRRLRPRRPTISKVNCQLTPLALPNENNKTPAHLYTKMPLAPKTNIFTCQCRWPRKPKIYMLIAKLPQHQQNYRLSCRWPRKPKDLHVNCQTIDSIPITYKFTYRLLSHCSQRCHWHRKPTNLIVDVQALAPKPTYLCNKTPLARKPPHLHVSCQAIENKTNKCM